MADPTDNEILTALKASYLAALLGKSYEINGRALSRQEIDKLASEIQRYEAKILVASDQTGGIATARFGDPN